MKKTIMVLGIMVLFIGGCGSLIQSIADPNSGINQAVDAVGTIATIVGAGAAATPAGAAVGIFAAIIAAAAGVYNNYRKKIVIDGKDADIKNIETTTKAIVEAIEELSGLEYGDTSIGETVKGMVKSKLKDREIYRVGKAIIDGLK